MTTLVTIIQDGGGSRSTMSEPEPKHARCNEGTPRQHKRTQGRRLAVTDGKGHGSPRFQARPVLLRMVKDTPVRRAMKRREVSTSTSISAAGTFISDCTWNYVCRLHNYLCVTYKFISNSVT